ncbi:MAG: hypothetical protein ACLFO2_03745 [Candidatus Woesearchaeota archaeon]
MDRVLLGSSLVFVALLLLGGGVLFLEGQDSLEFPFTGQATDSFLFLCINDPPSLEFSCPDTINQTTRVTDNTVTCQLNASDPDNDSLVLSVGPGNLSEWAWINDSGWLWLRPRQDQVGVNGLTVSARDASGCANGLVEEEYELTVLDINDPPEYFKTIPDVEFMQGSSSSPYTLYDHFRDPDRDPLSFEVFGTDVVSASVNPDSGMVNFRADDDCGTDYLLFRATDPFNASAESDVVQVKVICKEDQESGGGGGGGGGSFSPCTPKWKCDDWSECLPNGTRYKECIDLNGCNPNDYERTFWENCTYVPTCSDGIQNQGEEGVDCGGPCPPCGTCFDGIQNNDEEGVDCGGEYCEPCKNCSDGIQNWGETGVDCGGPCPPCPSCFDGIQNQNETGIDCGGPCPPCAVEESPGIAEEQSNVTLLLMVSGGFLLALLILFRLYHRQIVKAVARLGVVLTRHKRKQVLLSKAEKESLLAGIISLEAKLEERTEPASSLLESLTLLSRSFFRFALDLVESFQAPDMEGALKELVKHRSLRKVLERFFVVTRTAEQAVVEHSYVEVELFLEELRLLVFETSDASAEDLVHEAKEKDVSGSVLERCSAAFFDVLLALEFEELESARQRYVQLVAAYEELPEGRKAEVYDRVVRAYHHLKYAYSWSDRG